MDSKLCMDKERLRDPPLTMLIGWNKTQEAEEFERAHTQDHSLTSLAYK